MLPADSNVYDGRIMFNFFKRRECKMPELPQYIEPPRKEPEELYSVGRTNGNALMTLKLGHVTLTMTKHVCKDLITQLELVSNQLDE